jgi:hypothetical protein
MSSEGGHTPKLQHVLLIVLEPQHGFGQFFFKKRFVETDFE